MRPLSSLKWKRPEGASPDTFSLSLLQQAVAVAAPFVRSAGRVALDLVFPPRCIVCDADVLQHGRSCPACFGAARRVLVPFCHHCGVAVPNKTFLNDQDCCVSCQSQPPAWSHARAAFVYDAWSRRLILPLKYADRTENARFLAMEMARAGRALFASDTVLVPVPLHRYKLHQRRYNQAAMLASFLSRGQNVSVCQDALQRVRATRALARLSPRERASEIKNAIIVRANRQDRIRNRPILLIDDVLTTGATATICTEALLSAGALRVDLLVAARAGHMDDDITKSI